jgi:hypothetical protein
MFAAMNKGKMGKMFGAAALIAAVCVLICCSSCGNKNLTNPPLVYLVNNPGYLVDDTILAHGTTFSVWVYASKRGLDDLLETGQIVRSVNGGPDSTLGSMKFVATLFSQIYSYQAGDSGTTTRYTFIFGNQNGVVDSTSINIGTY